MKIQSFQYIQNQGWSIEKFPELDSTNTLILVFASPAFRTNTKPIQELAQALTVPEKEHNLSWNCPLTRKMWREVDYEYVLLSHSGDR